MGVIRVGEETQNRLKLMKGKSVDDKIEMMLDYFDSTGADPSKKIINPVFEVEKQVERVVKIMRNIENKKITPMLSFIEQIYESKGSNVMNNDLKFTEDELQKIEQLGEELRKKDTYIETLEKKLLSKNEKSESSIDISKVNEDFEEVKNTISELDESKKTTTLDNTSYLINRNIFNSFCRKITTISNEYVR